MGLNLVSIQSLNEVTLLEDERSVNLDADGSWTRSDLKLFLDLLNGQPSDFELLL